MLTADVMGNNGKDIESLDVLITVSHEGGAQIVIAKEEVDEFANNKAEYAFNLSLIHISEPTRPY